MQRRTVSLAANAVGILALAVPASGGEQIVLQSGVDAVHGLAGPPCCLPMSSAPFTVTELENVIGSPLAVQIAPHPTWVTFLDGYPQARWIAPVPAGSDLPAPAWVGSALYAVQFQVTTLGDPLGTLELAWAADDSLGDPIGPNPIGAYLNGVPLPEIFCGPTMPIGGFEQRFALQHDVQLRTGTNTLVLYQRDMFADASGLVFNANIAVGLCGSVEYSCLGQPNSTGYRGRIGLSGCLDVHHEDTFVHAWNLPDGYGLFIYGEGGFYYPFGNGYLCIDPYTPGLFRMSGALQPNASGVCSCLLDFGGLSPAGAITPGSTWTFQYVYRDVPSGSGVFTLTDAIDVTFCN
jgi:hypothetical protein